MTKAKIMLAALLLGSCQSRAVLYDIPESTVEERLQVAEENLRRAAAASTAMVNRVERLERRVTDLELLVANR